MFSFTYAIITQGQDDMRQDAVMQQIFELVNVLLREDRRTRDRGLQMRTYKVVSLSPVAGVLEWVQNTIPIAQYLIGERFTRTLLHV